MPSPSLYCFVLSFLSIRKNLEYPLKNPSVPLLSLLLSVFDGKRNVLRELPNRKKKGVSTFFNLG